MLLVHKGNIIIAYFEGEVDMNSVNKFRVDMNKVWEEADDRDIVINLNKVTYINSEGLGVIIELYKKLKLQRKSLKIVCSSPVVREVLEVVKFNKIIQIFDNDEELDCICKK